MDKNSLEMKEFFSGRPTDQIAKDLLGRELIRYSKKGPISGYIVETEAYLGQNDSAAHAFKGRKTVSNAPLYGQAGTIYIYTLRGHFLFDVVTQDPDVPQGVLIRAVEPHKGIHLMEENRRKKGFELSNGPGKVMQAFGIHDSKMNFLFLSDETIQIGIHDKRGIDHIGSGPRIGVSHRGSSTFLPLRFFVKGNPYVSQTNKSDITKNHGWSE
ncbi:DNA-3-methyladenine glycosylase [Oenococcus alcoholitolerans]|uniref:DNA-3-methyladenine glycosylase n=1 Tax=Oenococcus alcoholitolerans TaxID=931074 RepID=UPI003F702241